MEKTSFRAWLSLGILLLMTLCSNVDRNIIGMLVEPIKGDLHIDDVQFSLLVGFAFALFFALASLPMGWLADRFSRRWILYLGVSFWSLFTAACGLAHSFSQLLVARFAVGVGEASLNPAGYSIISDLFPKRRLTLAIAVMATGAAIASGIGAATGGYIIHWAESIGGFRGYAPWQVVFWVVGIPGMIMAPLVFLIPRPRVAPTAPKMKDTTPDGFVGWFRGNALYFLAISLGIGAHTAMGTTGMWNAAFLARSHGLDIRQIGLLMALIGAVPTSIGYLGGGWLVDRMVAAGVRDAHLRFLMVNTLLLCVVGIAAYGFVTDLRLLLALLAVVHMLLPCAGPALAHLQMSAPPRARARVVAMLLTIMHFAGTMVGSSAAAMFSEYLYGGPQFIGRGVASVYAVGAVVALLCFAVAVKPARKALANGPKWAVA